MQQIAIDRFLMAMSVLLTSPENYLQINSQDVDIRPFMRTGVVDVVEQTCNIPEMRNLSSVLSAVMDNQLAINRRVKNIMDDLKTNAKYFGGNHALSCDNQQVGEVIIKLPNLPTAFPVRCVSNEYGDNWLLIAQRDVESKLLYNTTTQSIENSVGDPQGEYFIGFKKLRAITESYLCELLFVFQKSGEQNFYDHFEAVAFGADNMVKMLGQHKTNGFRIFEPVSRHANAVNSMLALKSAYFTVTVYLRRTTLDVIPQLKKTT
ncbi:uncharacterized protein LOC118734656 isoform X1 [Rhagoletis pomonella]|uniref:uncharacterized protein LOC118734656 isoform X1 n=1 Tax=Rhagoletis pomonella TaxID=28610 RepID=UPI0017859157|nr:uncharacterized protein LOC118734656 isoform X1 [Rhagoletis pomonella]